MTLFKETILLLGCFYTFCPHIKDQSYYLLMYVFYETNKENLAKKVALVFLPWLKRDELSREITSKYIGRIFVGEFS